VLIDPAPVAVAAGHARIVATIEAAVAKGRLAAGRPRRRSRA